LIYLAGYVIYEQDVLSTILHCESMGYEEENIIIDVVLNGNPFLPHEPANIFNAF
jgi:hypothetical protein